MTKRIIIWHIAGLQFIASLTSQILIPLRDQSKIAANLQHLSSHC